MKRFALLLIIIFAFEIDANTCTTFFINNKGQMVFGRNYDWITGNGMVSVNLKGLAKTSMKTKDGTTISWVSRYGSISFNQYGKEFPTGGMNEKGLVVELMWLDETKYPAPDSRPAVGVLQWIQYQLDNCASVNELILTDSKLRIASQGTTPLHYLVADASGDVASIEFLDGKMKVHRNKELPFPVLTNSVYEQASAAYLSASTGSNRTSFAFGNNSLDRFSTACSMVNQYKSGNINLPLIDYSFNILSEVAQGSHTKWSIVYDISNMRIHFKTLDYQDRKTVRFDAFKMNCDQVSKVFDMNQKAEGDVSLLFQNFSSSLNENVVERSFKESSSQFTVSKEGIKSVWEYALGISCEIKN